MNDMSRQIDRAVERARDRDLAAHLEGEREEKTLAARIEDIPAHQFDADLQEIVLPPPSCAFGWQSMLADAACQQRDTLHPIIRDMLAACAVYTENDR